MCEVRRKASSDQALLLFLVMCVHDAMQATCMLCAIWRTRDTVICGTDSIKCMIEHSGRCVKELEIVRHFQTQAPVAAVTWPWPFSLL